MTLTKKLFGSTVAIAVNVFILNRFLQLTEPTYSLAHENYTKDNQIKIEESVKINRGYHDKNMNWGLLKEMENYWKVAEITKSTVGDTLVIKYVQGNGNIIVEILPTNYLKEYLLGNKKLNFELYFYNNQNQNGKPEWQRFYACIDDGKEMYQNKPNVEVFNLIEPTEINSDRFIKFLNSLK